MTKKRNGIIEAIEREVAAQATAQKKHLKEDAAFRKQITTTLKDLPKRDEIIKVVGDTVDSKINGKLINIKEHLDSQDEVFVQAATERAETQKTLLDLSAKINPIDSARSWASEFVRGILYVGGLAAAISAIVYLLTLIHIL